MTRTLTVIRHSKAVHDGSRDVDRALAPRGLADAAVAGRLLLEHGITPDQALVSPALRTRQTWQAISAELGVDGPEPTIAERIYDNTVSDLIDVIREADPDATQVAVVGHNPSVHDLVLMLAADAVDQEPSLASSYPTSAIAVLEISTPWFDLAAGDAKLREYFVARAD